MFCNTSTMFESASATVRVSLGSSHTSLSWNWSISNTWSAEAEIDISLGALEGFKGRGYRKIAVAWDIRYRVLQVFYSERMKGWLRSWVACALPTLRVVALIMLWLYRPMHDIMLWLYVQTVVYMRLWNGLMEVYSVPSQCVVKKGHFLLSLSVVRNWSRSEHLYNNYVYRWLWSQSGNFTSLE